MADITADEARELQRAWKKKSRAIDPRRLEEILKTIDSGIRSNAVNGEPWYWYDLMKDDAIRNDEQKEHLYEAILDFFGQRGFTVEIDKAIGSGAVYIKWGNEHANSFN